MASIPPTLGTCPWLGGWDRVTPYIYITTRNHCHSPGRREPLSYDRQATYCLTSGYSACPGFSLPIEDPVDGLDTQSGDSSSGKEDRQRWQMILKFWPLRRKNRAN